MELALPIDRVAVAWLHRREPAVATASPETMTDRAAAEAAALGGMAGALTTGAAAVFASAQGGVGWVALPLAAAAMAGDLVARLLLHVELVARIAAVHGATVNEQELVRILTVNVTERDPHAEDLGRGRLARVARVELGDSGELLSKLVGETLLRNVLPVINIAGSAWKSWRLTRTLGRTADRYFRLRAVLAPAIDAFERAHPEQVSLASEALWFTFTADGHVQDAETLALAHVLWRRPDEMTGQLTRFVTDTAAFMARLEAARPEVRADVRRLVELATSV